MNNGGGVMANFVICRHLVLNTANCGIDAPFNDTLQSNQMLRHSMIWMDVRHIESANSIGNHIIWVISILTKTGKLTTGLNGPECSVQFDSLKRCMQATRIAVLIAPTDVVTFYKLIGLYRWRQMLCRMCSCHFIIPNAERSECPSSMCMRFV